MNFSFKKTVSYLLITSFFSGIVAPTLQAMEDDEKDGASHPSALELVTIGQTRPNRDWPPAIPVESLSPTFTHNPLDSIGGDGMQSPSSLNASVTSPSRVGLLPTGAETINSPASRPTAVSVVVDASTAYGAGSTRRIPAELEEVAKFLDYEALGQRPSLTKKQTLTALAMIGLFAYAVKAEARYLQFTLVPTADNFWANFTDDNIKAYADMLVDVSYEAMAWMVPTVILIASSLPISMERTIIRDFNHH